MADRESEKLMKANFEMTDRERLKAFWKEREAELMERYRQWYPGLTKSQIKAKVRRRLTWEQVGW